jgi:hypothetical protein
MIVEEAIEKISNIKFDTKTFTIKNIDDDKACCLVDVGNAVGVINTL